MKQYKEPYLLACHKCWKDFYSKSKTKYCPECKRYRLKESQPITKKCPVCNAKFETYHHKQNHTYCSKRCAVEIAYRRNNVGRFVIFNRDKFQCFYCGKISYKDGNELHVDHLYPRSKGGKNTADNLVTTCKECNLQKHDTFINKNSYKDIKCEIQRRNDLNGIYGKLSIKLSKNDSDTVLASINIGRD